MFKKILFLFCLLYIAGFVFGAVTNGSFETPLNVSTDWNVTDINCDHDAIFGGAPPQSTSFDRFNFGASAPHGNFVFRANMLGNAGGNSSCIFDLNHTQNFASDQNICFQIYGVGTDTSSFPKMWIWVGGQLMWESPDLDSYSNWTQLCLDMNHSGGQIDIRGRTRTLATNHLDVWYLDVFTHRTADNLQITNLTPATAFRYTDFNVEIQVRNGRTNELVNNADVNINFNNTGSTDMNFDSDRNIYWVEYNEAKGTYDYDINAELTNYLDDNVSSQIRVLTDLPQYIRFTPITNIPSYAFTDENISIDLTNETAGLSWRIDSNSAVTETVGYIINNSLDDCTQYKIFTANAFDYANGIWNYDDTLTFGNNPFNSIQKIWDANLERYEHSFEEDVLANDTAYFRLQRYIPMYCYNSVTDSALWDNHYVPSVVDLNGTTIDIFAVSAYADANSTLISPDLPALTSSISDTDYVFQLTGKIDTPSSSDLSLGTKDKLANPIFTGITVDLNNIYQTITNKNIASGFINFKSNSTSARRITLHNYAVSQKGFFSTPITLLTTNETQLPLILDAGTPIHYVREGENFIVQSEYIDPDGLIDKYEISAYISSVAPANRLKIWVFDAQGASDDPIEINETIGNLIDLTPSAPNRDIKIAIRLIDTNSNYYEIQSKIIKLVQFPYFPNDMTINATIDSKKVGDQPSGRVLLSINAPENLRGVRLYIRDANAGLYDGNVQTYYKDVDFSCNGFDCSFDYVFDDWLFVDEQAKKLTVSALLTTEDENVNSTLTARTIVFFVFYKVYETARIFETVERTNHDYRADEEINVVMQLRDGDLANLRRDISVRIVPETCDASGSGGNCTSMGVSYNPDSFLYDAETGYNYYFFREVFVTSVGGLMGDANYVRIKGIISDVEGHHQTTLNPLLAPKCNTYDTDCTDFLCFIANALAGLNHFIFGCTVQTSPIVTLTTNQAQEIRLDINASKSLTAPTQEFLICLKTDRDNIYSDALQQDLLCAVGYTFNEAVPDNYDFYITNEFSDLSKDEEDAQFIKLSVPYSIIMFNDIILMRQALDVEYSTSIDTVGELVYYGFNLLFTQVANPLVAVPTNASQAGLLTNVGFDFNFDRPIDPSYIHGLMFFKIKGLEVVNKIDLVQFDEELTLIKPEDLREFMNHEGKRFPVNETTIDIYASDFVKVVSSETVETPLVIDVPYDEVAIKQENISDENTTYESIPTLLKFQVIGDLVYNNQRNAIRRFVNLPIITIIEPASVNIIGSIVSGAGALISNPIKFLILNWFGILILLILIMFVAVVVNKFRKDGGSNISISPFTSPTRLSLPKR